ncbi:MAG: oligosaccharide flippase family protein [Bacteroidota bacterium]|nr:oligosaccharide flippase family protein [Bacteroidota bacterium]
MQPISSINIKSKFLFYFKNKILRNFSYLFVFQILNTFFPLFTIPIITKVVTINNFGIFNYANSYLAYFGLLINYGFEYSASRNISNINLDSKSELSKIFSVVFFSKILLTLAASVLVCIVFYYDRNIYQNSLLNFSIFLGMFQFLFMPTFFFIGISDMKYIVVLTFFSKFFHLLIIVFFLKNNDNFIMVNFVSSFIQIILGLVGLFICIKKFGLHLKIVRFKEIYFELKNGFPNFLSWAVISFYTTFNVILLGLLTTVESVAYYSTANKVLIVITQLILMPISLVLFPYISKLVNQDKKMAVDLIDKLGIFIGLTIFGMCCLVFLFSETIINLIFGIEYLKSTSQLKIMAFIPLFIFFSNLYGIQGLLGFKLDRYFFYMTILLAAISLILNVIFVPKYKEMAASIILFLIEFLAAALSYFLFHFQIKVKSLKNV